MLTARRLVKTSDRAKLKRGFVSESTRELSRYPTSVDGETVLVSSPSSKVIPEAFPQLSQGHRG